jgi:hypothetical protein
MLDLVLALVELVKDLNEVTAYSTTYAPVISRRRGWEGDGRQTDVIKGGSNEGELSPVVRSSRRL